MARYRKKPVEIEAMQWDGTLARAEAIMEWSGGEEKTPLGFDVVSEPIDFAWIETLEGEMTVRIDDWVIRGVAGEFYPCKPDIFKQTYEPVN